jgi:hypothetical protein
MNASRISVGTIKRALLAAMTCAALAFAQSVPETPTLSFSWLGYVVITVAKDSVFNLSIDATLTSAKAGVDTIFSEGFEKSAHSFTMVNGSQTNKWFVGTAAAKSGTKSAYIVSGNGTANNYDVESQSVVHMYSDVAFPLSSSPYALSFDWKGEGEPSYDYLRVFTIETSSTPPTAGTQLPTSSLLGTTYQGQSDWQEVNNISLVAAANSGYTKRLVFSWRNDGGHGTQPPAAVDNIKITYPIHSTLSYQWYQNAANSNTGGTPLTGATKAYFVVPTASLGPIYYYVAVTNTVEGQTATATSDPFAVTVEKSPAPSPQGVTVEFRTRDTVKLAAISGYQYSKDAGVNWQNNSLFTGLKADSMYIFYQRIAETETTKPSTMASAYVRTSAYPGYGTAESPFQISKPDHLAQLAFFVNSGNYGYDTAQYKLMANIDISEIEDEGGGGGLGRRWEPARLL